MHVVRRLFGLRIVRYYTVAPIAVIVNFIVFNAGLWLDLSATTANFIAFVTGGQVNFWLHDRRTFSDRYPELTGWHKRWMWFMAGNMVALTFNTAAALALDYMSLHSYMVHFGALGVSAVFNFVWNNFISHRKREVRICSICQFVEESEAA